jgi:hypothetical protein
MSNIVKNTAVYAAALGNTAVYTAATLLHTAVFMAAQ